MHRPGNQPVRILLPDHQHAIIHGIGGKGFGILRCHSLCLPQLIKRLGIPASFRAAGRIQHGDAAYIRPGPLRGGADPILAAQQHGIRQAFVPQYRRGLHSARFIPFRQHDAFFILSGLFPDPFDHVHGFSSV